MSSPFQDLYNSFVPECDESVKLVKKVENTVKLNDEWQGIAKVLRENNIPLQPIQPKPIQQTAVLPVNIDISPKAIDVEALLEEAIKSDEQDPDSSREEIAKVYALEEKLKVEQRTLLAQKRELKERQAIIETNQRVQKTLDDYKAELVTEYYEVSARQEKLLSSIIKKDFSEIEVSLQGQLEEQKEQISAFITEISSANLDSLKSIQTSQINKIKDDIDHLLSEYTSSTLQNTNEQLLVHTNELESLLVQKLTLELESHKRTLSTEIEAITTAVDRLVTEKLKVEAENIDKLLINRSGDLLAQFSDNIDNKLQKNKDTLFDEFKNVSSTTASELFSTKTEELNTALKAIINEHRQGLNDTVNQKLNEVSSTVSRFTADIDGKLPQLDETIKDINKRIQTLVIEKKNVQLLVDDAKKYTDTKVAQVSEEVMNYARRILDLGSGGGSVAVQYANGGTMNGNLNVTGHYLSGGVNLLNVLSGSGNQTLSFDSTSANLSISNGNTVSLSALSGGSGGVSDRLDNGTVQVILSSDNLLHFPTGTIGDTLQDGGFTILGKPGSYAELASNDGNVYAWASDTNYGNPVGGGFSIGTDNTTLTGGHVWTFGNDGLLHFPDGSTQTTAFIGNGGSGPYVYGSGIGAIQPLSGNNTASGYYSNVGGGKNNTASGACSYIGGGDTNCTTSVLAVVVGGNHNCATGGTSFVGGGRVNTSSAQYSTVVGGNQNSSTGYAAFVGGGYNNNASGEYSSIIGGASNDTNSQANTFILGSNITASVSGYTYVNNLSSQGVLAGTCISLSQTPSTFINPVTASGTFLIVNINGTNKALQLWDYSS